MSQNFVLPQDSEAALAPLPYLRPAMPKVDKLLRTHPNFFFEFQIQRLAREERDMLTQQVNTLSTQVEAQNQVVRKLEEKERLLQTNLAALDKELSMRQQAMEMHKRKAIESAQSAADLKLHLEKYHAQIKEMQITVAEKTSSLEAEAFKTL